MKGAGFHKSESPGSWPSQRASVKGSNPQKGTCEGSWPSQKGICEAS